MYRTYRDYYYVLFVGPATRFGLYPLVVDRIQI